MTHDTEEEEKRSQDEVPLVRLAPPGRCSWLETHHLAIGVVALLLVVIVGGILLTLEREGSSSPQAVETDFDKSVGRDDAPVVVVEYGDFQ
ncbi:MAG TPA: hypothetical protein EYH31_13750 [Anaerolineae bacterium]|nr:hypothetical protein [Anaerolineae bacterium]